MAGNAQPLDQQFAIVDAQGRPTLYFIQWAQQRQIDISGSAQLDGGNNFTGDQNITGKITATEGFVPAYKIYTSGPPVTEIFSNRTCQVKTDQILLKNNQGSVSISCDTGSGNIVINNGANSGGAFIGYFSIHNRMLMDQWGIQTGFEFTADPYVSNNKIYHQGNLSFGSGLDYNAGTGVLTASGVTGSTPTVRASNIQSSNNSSYTVTWPAGTIAGDVVIIFGGHAFGFNNPANWIVLDNETGSNFNGAVFAKVMTAADILAGSVTITTAGVFNGVLAAVTITGTTMAGIRQPSAFVRNGAGPGATTATSITNQAPFTPDLILAFAASRVTGNITFSAGITSLQAINAANASGAVGDFTGTLTALGMVETWQSSVAGSGYYTAAVALRGP